MSARIMVGDCLATLATLPAGSVQCCVTSPPYYGLRDYGMAEQIGLEETPDAYVARLVDVFREVRRVLRDDGTLWLNLGDSYGAGKQLQGIPWRVAFALQADGWTLRSAIVWAKPNPMPESVTDRPTSAYEMVFLMSKAERYFYDAAAICEDWADERGGASGARALRYSEGSGRADTLGGNGKRGLGIQPATDGRNARNVWTIASQPFSGAHFATMPADLAERCIKAGSRPGDTVLDPFGGAGTTGLVADRLNRDAILCELNPAYADLARDRLTGDAPLFAVVA